MDNLYFGKRTVLTIGALENEKERESLFLSQCIQRITTGGEINSVLVVCSGGFRSLTRSA